MISELKRKSLAEYSQKSRIRKPQGLQHFLNNSPWSTQELRNRRIERLVKAIKGKKIIIIIDETGDLKKGKKTDYVVVPELLLFRDD